MEIVKSFFDDDGRTSTRRQFLARASGVAVASAAATLVPWHAAYAGNDDMSRLDKKKAKGWEFAFGSGDSKSWSGSNKYGKFKAVISENNGDLYAKLSFQPGKKLKDQGKVAFIQVLRSGTDERWFTKTTDLLSLREDDAVMRSDANRGWRLDRIGGENTPFFGQENRKKGEDYDPTSFNISKAQWAEYGRDGHDVAKLVDGPGVRRIFASFPKTKYPDYEVPKYFRIQFLACIMNLESGEIYGMLEWGGEAKADDSFAIDKTKLWAYKPELIKKGEPIKGRDAAFGRWNGIYCKQAPKAKFHKPANHKDYVEVPGEGVHWG